MGLKNTINFFFSWIQSRMNSETVHVAEGKYMSHVQSALYHTGQKKASRDTLTRYRSNTKSPDHTGTVYLSKFRQPDGALDARGLTRYPGPQLNNAMNEVKHHTEALARRPARPSPASRSGCQRLTDTVGAAAPSETSTRATARPATAPP